MAAARTRTRVSWFWVCSPLCAWETVFDVREQKYPLPVFNERKCPRGGYNGIWEKAMLVGPWDSRRWGNGSKSSSLCLGFSFWDNLVSYSIRLVPGLQPTQGLRSPWCQTLLPRTSEARESTTDRLRLPVLHRTQSQKKKNPGIWLT